MTVGNTNTLRVPYFKVNERTGRYSSRRGLSEAQIIKAAKVLLANKVLRSDAFNSSRAIKDYLITHYSEYKYEVFICLFCDIQNRLITSEIMFKGTIGESSVYPREVVRRAIELNAATVFFAHNHPSGSPLPSVQDRVITRVLKNALELIAVKVPDHLIIAGGECFSFADHGLIN
jgi:DNA repair protein RadC